LRDFNQIDFLLMKKIFLQINLMLIASFAFAQSGSVIQGAGAVNMSMGGAATAQPLDISGALQWNPASISAFDNNIIKLDIGLFISQPEVSSSLPEGMLWPADAFGPGSPASPAVSGTTAGETLKSPLPSLAMVWAKPESKHTFGASIIGISGFSLSYPQETNLPMDASGNPNPNWDPNNSNPVLYPQAMNGFGQIQADYMLMQLGVTYAYEISDKFSVGIEPTLDYANLELLPNPTADPTLAGYPKSDNASAMGYGAQLGIFFDSGTGIKAGASYKSRQYFSDFEFTNTYLDNTTGESTFNMGFPSILSLGLGYSKSDFDLAVDYRMVDYENTPGFAESGWSQTLSVNGFGWQNISILSAGLQYKGIERLPLRFGYTYNTVPITEEMVFFNVPAPAVINNAFQFGFSYIANEKLSLDAVYHHGSTGEELTGLLANPHAVAPNNPMGYMPGTSVSYNMTTNLIMIGLSYNLR
jgi:long-chain fatty acid transport protein